MRRPLVALFGAALGLAIAGFVVRAYLVHRGSERVRGPERGTCQPGPTTPGIDVSYHQEAIDWPRVRRAGIRFAFIRLSDGATVRDPRFQINWAEAGRAGVRRGAYQYFRPDQSVTAQADLMIRAMARRERGDLPPVLDIEIDAGLPAAVVAERAAAWIAQVRARLRVEPIVYTNGDLWRNGGADALATQPLWLAHYTRSCTVIPPPWTRWTFWQHTDHGAVPGIEGPVDLDWFAGTFDDLVAAE